MRRTEKDEHSDVILNPGILPRFRNLEGTTKTRRTRRKKKNRITGVANPDLVLNLNPII